MRAVEVTMDNFEDLLAYDDVLLDYFNTFLVLPVFSQPLYYNRLTGIFEVLYASDESYSQELRNGQLTPLYGATDEEREHMMDWAKKERLPVFFRSYLFREYKLCRLLLRPLGDRASAGHRSGTGLRGYSRQTADSCLSSLSRGPNSAKDVDLTDSGAWREAHGGGGSTLYKYNRPGSRAFSLPIYAGLGTYRKKSSGSAHRSNSSNGNSGNKRSEPVSEGEASGGCEQVNDGPLAKDLKGSSSNPTVRLEGEMGSSGPKDNNNTSEMTAHPFGEDVQSQQVYFDMICKENYTVPDYYAADDFGLDEQTEEGIRDLEERHKMSLQEIKELMLGSVQSLENFKNFLQNTSGKYLFEFWMDCEFYKDSLEDMDGEENVLIRSRFFRNIQDKYKLTLNADAIQQFVSAAGQFGLTKTIFNQTQYDTLRRLRAYWIPRYLIHKERVGELRVGDNLEDENCQFHIPGIVYSRRSSGQSSLFPSVCLVSSLPVIPDEVSDRSVSDPVRQTASRSISQDASHQQSQSEDWLQKSMEKNLKQKFLVALEMERKAGSPFQLFLQKSDRKQLLCNLLFWEDVRDFSHTHSLSADRNLRLIHGWDIFNKYLAADSEFSIGLTEEERDRIHNVLLPTKNFINVHTFSAIRNQSVDCLQDAWICYLKQDLKTFLDYRTRSENELSYTINDIEVTLDGSGQWLTVRLKPPTPLSQESEVTMEEKRMEKLRNRQMCLEQRKIMEKERRKAINAARKRQREMRNALSQGAGGAKDDDEQSANAADLASTIDKPTFKSCQNNKRIMSAFKRHLAVAAENPDLINAVSLFEDIELYLSFGDGVINRPKKEMQATHISKSYLQPASKKKVPLNPIILTRLRNEKDRPKTPTLKDIHNYLLPIMESGFDHFVNLHVQQMMEVGAASATRPVRSGAKSRENTIGSNKSAKVPALTKDAFEAALMQSILTRPGLPIPPSTQAPNSAGLPFDAQKFNGPQQVNVLQRDRMLSFGAMMQKRQKPYKGKLPPLHRFTESSFPEGEWKSGMTSFDWYSGVSQGGEQPEPTTNQKQRKKSVAAKMNPTKDDRAQFLLALSQAAAGHLPTHMWLYYEYLVQHGEEEGNTRLDRDLFFYCEVFKFKEASHAFADEELLKRKVQSIADCYLDLVSQSKESTTKESATKESATQIDVSTEILQKTLKAAQKYVAGKDVNSSIFEDAQNSVFKELLPYWVGFMRNYTPPLEDRPVPLTKQMKERRRKLEEILSWKPPPANNIVLPGLPEGSVVASFTFTINDGFKWKEGRGTDEASVIGRQVDLDDVEEVVAHPSNIPNRKTSIISHSTTGDFKTNVHPSIITT